MGASRLGGLPDARPGFVWPKKKGEFLPFIVQLNCADLAPLDAGQLFPKEGLLSFFCAASRSAECAVFYFPPGTPLSQPRADGTLYPQAKLSKFEPGLSLPVPNSEWNVRELIALPWTDEDSDALVIKLEQVVSKKEYPETYPFQVGGYPKWVNDGKTPPDSQLLLQFPCPPLWDCWSNRGHDEGSAALYFFIKNEDLKALRFDRVTSQLQVY